MPDEMTTQEALQAFSRSARGMVRVLLRFEQQGGALTDEQKIALAVCLATTLQFVRVFEAAEQYAAKGDESWMRSVIEQLAPIGGVQ